jgi:hypothetical protein
MGQKEMAVKKTAKTRTHFSFRIDIWSKPNADNRTSRGLRTTTLHSPPTAPPSNAGLAPLLRSDRAHE